MDFGPRKVPRKTGKHALSLLCDFRLGHFLRSKIESEIIFLIKYYIITILKKIEAFRPTFNKVKKMDFPLYVQILRGRVQGFFFMLGS